MNTFTIKRMGDPVLRQISHEIDVDKILQNETQEFIDKLIETMRSNHGLGLAAPQVGHLIRLTVIEIPENSERYPDALPFSLGIYINPVITILNDSMQENWEGCLSVPSIRGLVKRPQKIHLKYFDREANKNELELEGFSAAVFQHEFDHLDGKLFIDRMQDLKTLSFLEEYKVFQKNG